MIQGFGTLLKWTGVLTGGIVYVWTIVGLWQTGEAGLAILGLFVPFADPILAFMVNTTLGLFGIGAIAMFLVGAAMESASTEEGSLHGKA